MTRRYLKIVLVGEPVHAERLRTAKRNPRDETEREYA